jgi:hypothetical protein
MLRSNIEEATSVEVETVGAQLQGLSPHQLGQVPRKFVGAGQGSPVYQHWNYANVAGQSRLDLEPDEIVRIVDASAAHSSVIVSHSSPIRASNTSHELTALVTASTKSSPSSIESISLKILPSPIRVASRSYSHPAA